MFVQLLIGVSLVFRNFCAEVDRRMRRRRSRKLAAVFKLLSLEDEVESEKEAGGLRPG